MNRRKRGLGRSSHNRIGQKRDGGHGRGRADAAEDHFHSLLLCPPREDEEEERDDDGDRQKNIIGSYNHLLSWRLKRLRRQSTSAGRVLRQLV